MKYIHTLARAAVRFYNRDGSLEAAALAYYTPFALTPLIFVSMTVLSMVYGTRFVIDMLLHWGSVLGPEITKLLELATINLRDSTESFSIPIIGTLFFSSAVIVTFNTLTSGFNHLWEVPHSGVTGWLRKCWRSIVFVFVLQAYFIFMMGIDGLFLESGLSLLPLTTSLIAATATTLLFYLMYRFLPQTAPSRTASLIGAITAAILLIIAKGGVDLYLAFTPVPQFFDAAGLIVVLLIWIYVAATIVYYGAAVVHEHDRLRNSNN